jgi:hypothetical protein
VLYSMAFVILRVYELKEKKFARVPEARIKMCKYVFGYLRIRAEINSLFHRFSCLGLIM